MYIVLCKDIIESEIINSIQYKLKTGVHWEHFPVKLDIISIAWIEPYSEVGGRDFIKKLAPRQFTLVGSFNYNPSGTITLGLAEAGAKISSLI